jgi:AraC-like DNA-binding protein
MTLQSCRAISIHGDLREEHLRFWRPVPREDADIICGEGAVAALPLHTHQALQILLPASRFAVVHGGRPAARVRPGQVYVAAPLELYGARSLDGATCAMRVLLVAPEVLAAFGDDDARLWRGAPPGRRQFVVDDQELYTELWTLIGDLHGPLVVGPVAPRLLACLRRLLARLPAPVMDAQRPAAGRQAGGVARVRDHLRAHATKTASLDELASVAGLSKYFMLRSFSRVHGLTPHAYQVQLRLAHAWRLIVAGMPLSRVTYDAGFADQSHLTRQFAAQFGVTPARYVRQLAVSPGVALVADRPAEPLRPREQLLSA